MYKNLLFCILLVIHSTCLWAAAELQETSKVVNLRLPPASSSNMQYVKELLTKAYVSIGYKIDWINIAGSQELELASKGRLAGAFARHPIIEEKFPTLVKVPYKLFDFKLLKVSDRRRCGYCLDEDINSIIFTKGAKVSEKYVQSLRSTIDKLPLQSTTKKLNGMIFKRRADSVLIMDFQLDEKIAKNHHMIVETILHEYDYHYLSPRYKHLQQPLADAFEKLEQNGTVAQLQQKYKIKSSKEFKSIPEKINFISGNWLEYTNADGTGVYWNIIDSLFDDDFSVTKSTSTWARAIRAFETNQADVLVGAYRKNKIKNAIFSSFHIDYEYPLFAFARNEDVLTRFKARDESLSACLSSGSSFFKYVDFLPRENIIESSLMQCDALIKSNKVDIVVEYDYNLNQHTQALPRFELVEHSPLFLVFHDTLEGHFLKSYFDGNIVKLAREDILKKIFPDERTYKQAHIRP